MMQESAQGLSSEERSLINRVLDLQSLTVSKVMTPLEKAVMVPTQMRVEEVLVLARGKRFSRIPVSETRGGVVVNQVFMEYKVLVMGQSSWLI